jgi:PII-like signaling protein
VSDLTQMRFHFGERDRDGDGPLEAASMDACARHEVRAAALMRGIAGFGAKHHLRTDRLLSLSEDPPLMAVAVGDAEVIEALAEEVRGLAGQGLMVLETTTTGPAASSAAAGPVVAEWVKVTIWGPRRRPASPHREAVAALKRHGAESATVLLGVDGVLDGERRRARFVAGNRGVPAMTVGVGPRTAIDAAVAEVDGAANLVTVEAVEPCSRIGGVSHRGDAEGSATVEATRVTLVTSEVASRGSRPVYLEFIHRLRREGAAGATAQRGVWGFRGEEEPRGDRVSALRRGVPMVVEVIDAPERAARWHEIARELACEGDVVYAQRVVQAISKE